MCTILQCFCTACNLCISLGDALCYYRQQAGHAFDSVGLSVGKITRNVVDKFQRSYLEGGTCDLQPTVRFWWWPRPQRGSRNYFMEFLPVQDSGNFKNFVQSAALAKVRTILVLLV